jgi:hypothetical protein
MVGPSPTCFHGTVLYTEEVVGGGEDAERIRRITRNRWDNR